MADWRQNHHECQEDLLKAVEMLTALFLLQWFNSTKGTCKLHDLSVSLLKLPPAFLVNA